MEKGGGIVNSAKDTRQSSFEELKESAWKRLNSMLGFGITTIEGKSGYGLNTETELKQIEVMEKLKFSFPIDIVITEKIIPEIKEITLSDYEIKE
ncbi:MAG: hypothetical protein ACOCQ2_00920 [Halanaerobiales bacterium]